MSNLFIQKLLTHTFSIVERDILARRIGRLFETKSVI